MNSVLLVLISLAAGYFLNKFISPWVESKRNMSKVKQNFAKELKFNDVVVKISICKLKDMIKIIEDVDAGKCAKPAGLPMELFGGLLSNSRHLKYFSDFLLVAIDKLSGNDDVSGKDFNIVRTIFNVGLDWDTTSLSNRYAVLTQAWIDNKVTNKDAIAVLNDMLNLHRQFVSGIKNGKKIFKNYNLI